MLLDEPSNHLDIETTDLARKLPLAGRPSAWSSSATTAISSTRPSPRSGSCSTARSPPIRATIPTTGSSGGEKAKVLQRQSERQKDQIADLEAYIRKYGAGQRAKQAHDREKKLARIERVETMRDIVGRRWALARSNARATSSSRHARSDKRVCDNRSSDRLQPVRPAWPVRRHHGPQRRGQDDPHQDPDRPREARCRRRQARP